MRFDWRGPTVVAALAALTWQCTSASPAGGKRLVVAIARDAGPLNVYIGGTDALIGLVYDKLFEPSPFVTTPDPGLAESATQVDDLTWVVRIRDGVTWHDGRPFTAEDVQFTFETFRDGPSSRYAHHVSQVPRIDRVQITAPREITFTCGYPCPTLANVTFADLPILPKHIWEGVTTPREMNGLPVGTGPFRLVEYSPDGLYRLRANTEYYRGRPLIDELVVPIVPDQAAMFLGLRTGDLDAAARPLPPEVLREFSKTPGIEVLSTHALAIIELRPNYSKPPFNRAEFRQALSLAVDRQALVDTVLLGLGRPGTKGYPHPDSPWSNPALDTPFDRPRAERLFDELGYVDRNGDGVREDPAGAPLGFRLMVQTGEPLWIRSAELLIEQFARVGIAVTVDPVEAGVLSDRSAARDYDLFISQIGAHGAADPDQFVMSHLSGYLWRPELPFPEMDGLIAKWKRTNTVESRRSAGFEIQTLFNQRPTSIALYYPEERWAVRPAVFNGWTGSPAYGIFHKWSFLPADARVAAR